MIHPSAVANQTDSRRFFTMALSITFWESRLRVI